MALSCAASLGDLHDGLEDGSRQLHSRRAQPFVKLGADAGSAKSAGDSARFGKPGLLENEDVLHGNQIALHAYALCDVRDTAGTIAEAGNLNEHVDGRADLLAHGTDAHIGV